MPSNRLQFFRGRSFAWFIQVGLWCLLYLSVIRLGGNTPDYTVANISSTPAQSVVPAARLDPLFGPVSPRPAPAPGAVNSPNPFYTQYFVPPPSPAPPTTRKIEVTYQGFYQTADGPKCAILKLGDGFVMSRVGTSVATNVFVADATLQSLTLTNPQAQATLLPLNVKKEIEVPIK
jgi:hypothetical protein